MKKKCLFIIQNLSNSGSPRTFLHVIDRMKEHFDIDVLVYGVADNNSDLYFLNKYKAMCKNVIVHNQKTSSKLFRLFPYRYCSKFLKLVDLSNYYCIWTHYYVVASYLTMMNNKTSKIIYYSLGMHDIKSKIHLINYRNTRIKKRLNNIDLYISLSSNCFCDEFDKNNNYIVLTDYPDIDTPNGKICEKKGGKIVLGHIGYYCANKNQMFLLSLLKQLINSGVDAELKLIGYLAPDEEDYYDKMINYISDNQLNNYVRLLPSNYDKHLFFQNMDFFLFPSYKEGLGLSLIEAQLYQVKAISSPTIPVEADLGLLNIIDLNDDLWVNAILHPHFEGSLSKDLFKIKRDFNNGVSNIVHYLLDA